MSSPNLGPMKLLVLLSILFCRDLWAQTPFAPYLVPSESREDEFYIQQRRHPYPFEVGPVSRSSFDLEAFTREHSSNALDARSALFKNFSFLKKDFLYNYPFAVAADWEFLPHPYVSEVNKPENWIEEFRPDSSNTSALGTYEFHQELSLLTGTEAYAGHEVSLFKTPHSYQELLKRMALTKSHVFMSTYLFHCDSGSEPLLEMIERKTREGVRVFVIYDRFYSKSDPSCARKLRERGAQVALHSNGRFMNIFHEKMYVFDGEYALVDGQNLIAIQTKSTGVNNLLNDVGMGLKGPVVTKIAERFITHWSQILRKDFPADLIAFYQNQAEAIRTQSSPEVLKAALKKPLGQGVCRLVTKDPGAKNSQILDMYLHTMRHTSNYLFFNYMDAQPGNAKASAPGGRILKLLSDLSREKPELRIDMLTNNWKTPTNVLLPAGQSAYRNRFTRFSVGLIERLMPPRLGKIRSRLEALNPAENFHWWSYAQFMHSKTLMSDNLWTIIGTHNLNKTSENSSFELAVACLDSGLAREMQHSIVTDLLNSIPVPLK